MPRDLETLKRDGETAETLRSALDALDEIKPPAKAVASIAELRAEIQAELRLMEDQGSLF